MPLDIEGAGADNIVDDLYRGVMWHVLITNYMEQHAEGNYIHDAFEDVFTAFSMGSMPIQVMITGYVPNNPDYNCKLDFITYFNLFLRGTSQNKYKIPIIFNLHNVYMHLRLQSLEMVTDPAIPDFTAVNITGVGYKYHSIENNL